MKEYHHLTPALVEELKGIVGEKYVYTDKDKLIPYEKDEGVEREYFHLPEAVVLPETAEQTARPQ